MRAKSFGDHRGGGVEEVDEEPAVSAAVTSSCEASWVQPVKTLETLPAPSQPAPLKAPERLLIIRTGAFQPTRLAATGPERWRTIAI